MILALNTYDPDLLARTYAVLFLDADVEAGWANLVALRNADYAKYLTPPSTAAGTKEWDWLIRTGQMANTVERLNEKWNRTIQDYIAAAIAARQAMIRIESKEQSDG
jgi:hypothetical protein